MKKKLLDKFSTVFSNQNSNKRCNRSTWKGAVFDESFFWKIPEKLLKKPVFRRVNANWIHEKNSVTKQYNNKKNFSTKLTLV